MKISPFSGPGQFLRMSGSAQLSSIDRSGQIQESTGPQPSPNQNESIGPGQNNQGNSSNRSGRTQPGDTSNQTGQAQPGNGANRSGSPGTGRDNQQPPLPNGQRPAGLIDQSSDNRPNSNSPVPGSRSASRDQSGNSGSSGNQPPATNIPDSYQSGAGDSSSQTGVDNQQSGDEKGPNELTPTERKQVQKLKRIDAKVRAHEQAHLAAAGPYAQGGPSYEYTTGPDGKRYAVGGSVSLDTSKADTPEKTIKKMQSVRQAALAPANPSSQDMSVANEAAQKLNEARARKQEQENKQQQGKSAEGAGEGSGSEQSNNTGPESGGVEGVGQAEPGDSGSSEPFAVEGNNESGRAGGDNSVSEPFKIEGDNGQNDDETEFFDDFGELAPASDEANETGQGDESSDAPFVEQTEDDNDGPFIADDVGAERFDNDEKAFGERESDNEEQTDDIFTSDARRRQGEANPGQVFDLVI